MILKPAHLGHPVTGGQDCRHGEQVKSSAEGWGSIFDGSIGDRKGEMAPVKTWKNFFSAPTITNSTLDFFSPSCVDGTPVIHPLDEAVFEGMSMWKGCLVGQFFDKHLPLHVVRAAVDKLWGKHEMPEISTTNNGLYLFRFRDMDARDWVMESCPWYIIGRPIILRVWQPSMEMLNIQLTYLPIWVKFYNIPLEYWTNTCLGYIASAVRKPLHLDSLTENRTRLSFARICIEVDLNSEFPKAALLNLGNGKYTTVRIEYPWVPHSCSHCKVFGHKILHCPFSKARSTKPVPDSSNPYGNKGARHGNGEEEIADSRIGHHKVSKPIKELNEGVDSVIDSIRDCPSMVPPVTSVKTTVKVNGGDASLKRHRNTFEYLALSEVSAPPVDVVELASTSSVIPDTGDYSDTSPNCDTFKQIKIIDELNYSPLPLPLSKSKLRRLKKHNRDPKHVDGRSVTLSHD